MTALGGIGSVGKGLSGEARATALGGIGSVGKGLSGEARATALGGIGSVGKGLSGEVAAKAVEVVARNAARTKWPFEIEDIEALLPWFKL